MPRQALLCLLAAAWSTAAFAAPTPQAGKIFWVSGDVELLAPARATRNKRKRQVSPGSPFFVGDTVVSRDGEAKLVFREGNNEVLVGPHSTLAIARASIQGRLNGTTLDLSQGQIRSLIKIAYSGQGRDAFQVKTPNLKVSIFGTAYVSHIDGLSSVASEARHTQVTDNSGTETLLVEQGRFFETRLPWGHPEVKYLKANEALSDKVARLAGASSYNASQEYLNPAWAGSASWSKAEQRITNTTTSSTPEEAPPHSQLPKHEEPGKVEKFIVRQLGI